MKMSPAAVSALSLVLGLILVSFTGHCIGADLQVGFYKDKCDSVNVEKIVFDVVNERFRRQPRIAAALVRMHFHDCFVNGCDASILLDGDSSEKTAPPNQSVFGYDVIDEAKEKLETACKGVVSCADIIAMAARDAVALSKGRRYNVETGRRDGMSSSAQAANENLPSSRIPVPECIEVFRKKSINVTDMVLLIGGGHSIGFTHCSVIKDRLYNFQNSGQPDPEMDPSLLKNLRLKCPQASLRDDLVSLDQTLVPLSSFILDNLIYDQLMHKRGILAIDQALALHPSTNATVASLATSQDFPARFGKAMVKIGSIDVLTDPSQGEIRTSCSAINAKSSFLPILH